MSLYPPPEGGWGGWYPGGHGYPIFDIPYPISHIRHQRRPSLPVLFWVDWGVDMGGDLGYYPEACLTAMSLLADPVSWGLSKSKFDCDNSV